MQFLTDFRLDLRGEYPAGQPHREGRHRAIPLAHLVKGLDGIGGKKRGPVWRRGQGEGKTGIARHSPLNGKCLSVQFQLVEEIAAAGGVDQKQADALSLLLCQLVRAQAPEVSQSEIPGTVEVRIGALMAA